MFNRQSIHIALLLWGFIFSLIAAFCTSFLYHYDKRKRKVMLYMQLASALLLLSDAIAWGTRGSMYYYVVRVSNFFVFLMCDVIFLLFHHFVVLSLFKGDRTKNNSKIKIAYFLGVLSIVLVVISQFTHLYYYIDAQNYYHRNTYHFISIILPLLGVLIDFSLLIQYREQLSKTMFLSMMSYIVLPIISSIILIFYYGISLTNISISISMIFMFISSMIEQSNELVKKEQEATDLKINLVLSQVAPHFIFNTLTTIQQLCTIDPKMAQETVKEFAGFLRGNIDTLNKQSLISFEKELEHVNYYLAIEKKRFGDRVHVEYDIQEKYFKLPPMTLQPLVENAVKYGLCKKEEGGTILIQALLEEDYYKVIIKDDGMGFDKKILSEEGHTGIKSVKIRLNKICQGTLQIDSVVGKGTTATILIPRKEMGK